jgi:hypothetical protein
MNPLYPKIRLAHLAAMLRYAALGGLLGGLYGVVHDQITFSISQEYFTRLKFLQFHYADFGFPPRVFVAEIGFLATWWVGFIAAWFIARLTVPAFPRATAFRHSLRGFGIIFAVAFAGTLGGFLFGLRPNIDYSGWMGYAATHRVVDVPSFVRVAYIHNASYLGGLIGFLAALLYVWRVKKSASSTNSEHPMGGKDEG